jgi:hypothetical protein
MASKPVNVYTGPCGLQTVLPPYHVLCAPPWARHALENAYNNNNNTARCADTLDFILLFIRRCLCVPTAVHYIAYRYYEHALCLAQKR